MEIIFLGVGSSAGTPVIGCNCAVCSSANPRNKRTRASVAVKNAGQVLLIDTSPDLRLQALREGLDHIDGVLYTHPHADHLNGIDDLRAFCFRQKQAIPIFGNQLMISDIQQRFAYALLPPGQYWDKPVLTPHVVEQPFELGHMKVTPIPLNHGQWTILGYRIGNFAYLTDVSEIPASSQRLLQGLDLLLLDCLRYQFHPTHLNLEQAIRYAETINANQTYLIHMTHEMDYDVISAALPADIALGYDGLRVTL